MLSQASVATGLCASGVISQRTPRVEKIFRRKLLVWMGRVIERSKQNEAAAPVSKLNARNGDHQLRSAFRVIGANFGGKPERIYAAKSPDRLDAPTIPGRAAWRSPFPIRTPCLEAAWERKSEASVSPLRRDIRYGCEAGPGSATAVN